MGEITQEMVKQVYIIFKQVNSGQISVLNGAEELNEKHKMNKSTAQMHLSNLKYIINGQKYTRIMKPSDTKYYFTMIKKDYGENAFKNAIRALGLHVKYIEGLGKPSSVKTLFEDYQREDKR